LLDISRASSVDSHGNISINQIGSPIQSSSPIRSQQKPMPDTHDDPLVSCDRSTRSCSLSTDSVIPLPVKNNSTTRTLVINFQSIRPKKAELWNLIASTNPDIILGSETWLKPEISDTEIIPNDYDIYRKDRKDGWGGVLVATKKCLISQEIPTLSSSETVLVRLETENKREPLIVGSLYRSPSNTSDQQMCDIRAAIDSAVAHCKTPTLWLGGDLNLPDIDWEKNCVSGNRYPKSVSQLFLDKVNDIGTQQMVTEPTRGDALLDIFLSNRPDLVSCSTVIPGLSDHDIVLVDSRIRPTRSRPMSYVPVRTS